MTSTLTTSTETLHNLYFIHEGDSREFVKAYANRDSATSRGRKAVRDMDALAYVVETVDPATEVEVAPIEDSTPDWDFLTTIAVPPFVPEFLGDEDEMTGFVEGPTPRRRRASTSTLFARKVRVFLSKDERFTYGDHEVRVVTVRRTDTAIEKLGAADKVSIFGHRAGLIGTGTLGDAPSAVAAAFVARKLY